MKEVKRGNRLERKEEERERWKKENNYQNEEGKKDKGKEE